MAKCTKCSKLDKAALVAAMQAGIAAVNPEDQQLTIDAEIEGYIPAGNDNGSQQAIYGYPSYDPVQFGVIPVIESAEGHNPQCDGEGNSIGTLVINPLLPAGSSNTFDLTTTMLDNSGGGGGVFLFCPSTGQYTPYQSTVSSSFGNNTGPVTQTHTLDASTLSCPIEDVRVGIAAWGVSSSYDDDRCDHLSAEIGTLVVVTPSECAAALQCFNDLFGCSMQDMVLASGALSELDNKVRSIDIPVYKFSEPDNGYDVQAWFDNDDKAVAHPAGLNTDQEVDDFIDSVWSGPLDADGIPTHINGEPSQQICFDTNSNFNDAAGAFPDGEGSGLDQYRLFTCIDTRGLGAINLADLNRNSGEAGRILMSECCSPFEPVGRILDTQPFNAGQFATALPEGFHCIIVLLSDRSAFGGFQLAFNTGEGDFVNFPVSRMYKEKPMIECKIVSACDLGDTLGEWQVKPPSFCE